MWKTSDILHIIFVYTSYTVHTCAKTVPISAFMYTHALTNEYWLMHWPMCLAYSKLINTEWETEWERGRELKLQPHKSPLQQPPLRALEKTSHLLAFTTWQKKHSHPEHCQSLNCFENGTFSNKIPHASTVYFWSLSELCHFSANSITDFDIYSSVSRNPLVGYKPTRQSEFSLLCESPLHMAFDECRFPPISPKYMPRGCQREAPPRVHKVKAFALRPDSGSWQWLTWGSRVRAEGRWHTATQFPEQQWRSTRASTTLHPEQGSTSDAAKTRK